MYSAQQTESLQTQTTHFLSILNNDDAIIEIEDLRNVLRFHEYKYYVSNEPLITDFEYDQLYNLLERTEKSNPEIITKNSPTQRVGSSLNEGFETVQHLVPMLSLANSYNAEVLQDFDRKAKEAR